MLGLIKMNISWHCQHMLITRKREGRPNIVRGGKFVVHVWGHQLPPSLANIIYYCMEKARPVIQWLQWGVTFSQVVWLIGC
jgi:hypothetical protein